MQLTTATTTIHSKDTLEKDVVSIVWLCCMYRPFGGTYVNVVDGNLLIHNYNLMVVVTLVEIIVMVQVLGVQMLM
jgi:hypothetical protein